MKIVLACVLPHAGSYIPLQRMGAILEKDHEVIYYLSKSKELEHARKEASAVTYCPWFAHVPLIQIFNLLMRILHHQFQVVQHLKLLIQVVQI